MKNKKGFTLIELLAAIVILGIILTIAIMSISSLINSSREKDMLLQATSILDAVKLDRLETKNKKYLKEDILALFDKPIKSPWDKEYESIVVIYDGVYRICMTDGLKGINVSEKDLNDRNISNYDITEC